MTPGLLIIRSLHIAAGGIALIAGTLALVVAKGSARHRSVGLAFVGAMCTMALSGVIMASAILPNRGNVMGGLLTLYLVASGWATAWRPAGRIGRVEVATLLLGVGTMALGMTFGVMALQSTAQRLDGYPPTMYFIFGTVALLASGFDIRLLRHGGVVGAARTARHLIRLLGAFFMAVSSFFLGQAQVFSAPVRASGLLTVPVLLVVLTLLYWLWRIRLRPALRQRRHNRPLDTVA